MFPLLLSDFTRTETELIPLPLSAQSIISSMEKQLSEWILQRDLSHAWRLRSALLLQSPVDKRGDCVGKRHRVLGSPRVLISPSSSRMRDKKNSGAQMNRIFSVIDLHMIRPSIALFPTII